MITSKDEALELCKKFEIKLADHKTVIVTGNNSIYLSDNIDPNDTSEKFYLKGGIISIEVENKKVGKAKEPVSSEAEPAETKEISDSEIEEIKEEKENSKKYKKSYKK